MIGRLGVDAVRALRNHTGLGNYSRGILRAIHANAPALPITLYSHRTPDRSFASLPDELGATLRLAPGGGPRGSWWRTFRLGHAATRDGVTLYHGLSHEIPRDLPAQGIASVVTFHDLIYERTPELFPLVDRWSYRWRYRWSARHANAIVAVSTGTKRDLIQYYGIDPARIAVIPPACDPAFGQLVPPATLAATRARHQLPSEYLLSVGTLEARKNHRVLLDALALIEANVVPPLLLVGRDGGAQADLVRQASALGIADRVIFRGNVTATDLPALVQGASLFLYPSRLEGFGMPVVEAMAATVPVVAASGGSLDDAGGAAARFASPDEPEQWRAAVVDLLADAAERERRQLLGRAHARRFDAAPLAARLMAVYDAVISGGSLPGDTPPSEVPVEAVR